MAAFTAVSVRRASTERLIAYPTTRRDHASRMAARQTKPVAIVMEVMPATQSWLGLSTTMSFARSGKIGSSGSLSVVAHQTLLILGLKIVLAH
jgi:hypothetical protein